MQFTTIKCCSRLFAKNKKYKIVEFRNEKIASFDLVFFYTWTGNTAVFSLVPRSHLESFTLVHFNSMHRGGGGKATPPRQIYSRGVINRDGEEENDWTEDGQLVDRKGHLMTELDASLFLSLSCSLLQAHLYPWSLQEPRDLNRYLQCWLIHRVQ